jgi:hypothetical protein
MIRKWLHVINRVVAGGVGLLLLLSAALYFSRPAEIMVINDVASVGSGLPKGAFTLNREAYDSIGEPLLSLKFSPISVQLPDLRKALLYYGKNGRPDAQADHPLLHFAFMGNKVAASIEPGKPLYLIYDRKSNPPQYAFSPGNEETPLYMQCALDGTEATVTVVMKCQDGSLITEPSAHAQFTLPEKEYVRFGGTPWEIGKWRVDGSLLARQRARWYGPDRFLERHGGDEYSHVNGKHRIDFGEGEDMYSVFVGISECLIWDSDLGKWRSSKPGTETLGHPLLFVKKVDERLINLELWDNDGRGKLALNLLKSTENWMPQNLQQSFKFMGARTRSQFVFEVNKERMLIRPKDWLVLTEAGWLKLTTPEEIDNFVDRKITGALFVFDGVEKRDDKQVLVGTMFNSTRTEMQTVEMPILQGGGAVPPNPNMPPHDEVDADGDIKTAYKQPPAKEALAIPYKRQGKDRETSLE